MLFIAVLSCERAARPGRADRTVTRHLSQAGSYQVTTARTGRPDATDAAPGPGIDRSASTTPNGVSFVVGQIPSPNATHASSLFRRLSASPVSGTLFGRCRERAVGSDLWAAAANGAANTRGAGTMTKVTAQMSVSLDGFYTGPRDTRTPDGMSGWMRGPEAPGFFRVTRWVVDAIAWRERLGFAGGEQSRSSEIIEETFAAAGAYVMGRRMFDAGEVPWGEEPPFHAPVFVVTHRSRDMLERRGGTSFTFVTEGLERAIELARDAAGSKDVAVAGGGELLRQVLTAGLLDQLEVHIAPVLLGDGQRLFDASLGLGADDGIELVPTRVVEAPEVTHIRYTVTGRSKLVLDDRGASGDLVGPAQPEQ